MGNTRVLILKEDPFQAKRSLSFQPDVDDKVFGVSRECSLFFFSSRRRHTRFDCDWSSDVCSSDLISRLQKNLQVVFQNRCPGLEICQLELGELAQLTLQHLLGIGDALSDLFELRSEERRVGKEGRSRWSPYH